MANFQFQIALAHVKTTFQYYHIYWDIDHNKGHLWLKFNQNRYCEFLTVTHQKFQMVPYSTGNILESKWSHISLSLFKTFPKWCHSFISDHKQKS